MKLFDTKKRKIMYQLNPDLYFLLDDEYMELMDVLASERLDGHDRLDQWMMKLAIKMEELLDVMGELDDEDAADMFAMPQIL